MVNLVGMKFNRLTVIKFIKRDKYYNSYWKCKCECGNECIATAGSLRSGSTKSCGCLMREKAKELCVNRNTTHGKSHTRLYNIWCDMKLRCCNPKHPDYKRWYGCRGITICDEWRNDFQAFYNWAMENGYKNGLTIDRINNDGNYEPSNCRWATQKEQQNNRSTTHLITYDGKTLSLSQWAEKLSISRDSLYQRLFVLNWPIEKAMRKGKYNNGATKK